ncbi:MAG: KamA family radical SAM protein [Chitinivibrionales bacterium]|nr:KamA family radical SAM protein [Chitinivibrionales bacterium]
MMSGAGSMGAATRERRAYTAVEPLLASLELNPDECPYRLGDGAGLPMLVPVALVQRMRKGDWYDPVLLQVLPRAEEERPGEGFSCDPVGDRAAVVVPGLLHKYHARVLVMTTGACPMHCRYCFRRRLAERKTRLDANHRDRIARYVREHDDIAEVILSGGDPLMLGDSELPAIVEPLLAVNHVRTIRIHSRMPIADPTRVNDRVCALVSHITRSRTCVVVVHANCAREIGGNCRAALRRLRDAGAVLLCQSVLLRGINDSVDRLEQLCRELTESGVIPYYLHQLDRVQGAWHFEVPTGTGTALVRELRTRLPGYAVPTYVRETAGGACKQALG